MDGYLQRTHNQGNGKECPVVLPVWGGRTRPRQVSEVTKGHVGRRWKMGDRTLELLTDARALFLTPGLPLGDTFLKYQGAH